MGRQKVSFADAASLPSPTLPHCPHCLTAFTDTALAVLQAANFPTRSLVLMWPDYAGSGTYGLSCLNGYSGDVLVLVGEWHDSTLGAYTSGLSEYGQAMRS